MSSRNSAQWQAFVGPLYVPPSAPCSWDWTSLADLDLAGQSASLTATLTNGSQGIAHTGLAFPSFGGVWIGPNGSGQAWEYCGYGSSPNSTTLLSLQREPIPPYEHNGVHSAGATVYFWAPLATNDGRLHITEETNQALSAKTWTAEISGVLAPRGFLRRHHAVYVRERPGPEASWNPLLLGWIDEFQIDDDYKRHARWKIRVISIAGMLEKTPSAPLRSGDLDIAQYGRIVKEDVPLAAVWKEWYNGTSLNSVEEAKAKSAIDGDPSTGWISERVVGWNHGYEASDEGMHGEIFFAEANLGIVPGLGKGYRWFQLATIQNPIGDLIFCNKIGDVAYVDIGGRAGVGSRIFVVENLQLFTEVYPLADPTRIVEVGAGFFDAYDMANDHMAIWSADYAGSNWRGKGLQWGPLGVRARRSDSAEPDADYAREMTGPRLTIPTDGRVIAWSDYPGGDEHTEFYRYTPFDTAGYEPGESRPYPFFLLQLPGMGFLLKTDLSPSQTGTIELWDGKTTHTNGLPATGVLQIGSEQIAYANKTKTTLAITGRGQNGTTASVHDSDDPVYLVDNGQATDAMLIKEIRWAVPAGTPHPHHFRIWGSRFVSTPRYPIKDDEDPGYEYQNDYEQLTYQEWYPNDTYTLTLSPSKRVSWLLFEVITMNADLERARVNSFEAMLDTSLMDPSSWLPEGTTLRDCFIRLLLNAGIRSTAMNIVNPLATSNPFKLTTAQSTAWTVLADLADYTATFIDISLLSRITITNNKIWRTDISQTPTDSWNRYSAAGVQILAERSGPVGQVQMKWMNPDGTEAGTLVYPDLLDSIGDVQILKDSLYPDAATALAGMQRRYLLAKYPYSLGLQTAVGRNDVRPGEIHQINWNFDDGTTGYVGYVRDVDTVLEKDTWKTVLRFILYREVY